MRATLLAVASLMLVLSGCSDATGPESTEIVVRNRASADVAFVYISGCDSENWGNDRLGSEEVIRSGRDRKFGVEPGCWDLRIVLIDNREVEQYAIELDRGDEFAFTVTN